MQDMGMEFITMFSVGMGVYLGLDFMGEMIPNLVQTMFARRGKTMWKALG